MSRFAFSRVRTPRALIVGQPGLGNRQPLVELELRYVTMLSAPLVWHRKLLNISDPRVMIERLTEMQHRTSWSEMPKRVTDPNWLQAHSDKDAADQL